MKKVSLVLITILLSINIFLCDSFAMDEIKKIAICKEALAKINMNKNSDYVYKKSNNDVMEFVSRSRYKYDCEIFGLNITLSSIGWGRLKPTGNISLKSGCVSFKIYDPGMKKMLEGSHC